MRYAKMTLEYIGKHGFAIFLYTILPGYILSVAADPTDLFGFFLHFFERENFTFAAIFREATQLTGRNIALFLLAGVGVAAFIAALSGMIERDMRLGDFTSKHFFRRVNDNFISAMKIVLTILISIEIYGLLSASFIYMWCFVFESKVAAFVLSLVSVIILTLLLGVVFILFSLWYPHMLITGLKARHALSSSIVQVRRCFWRLVFTFGCVLLPMVAIFFAIRSVSPHENETLFLVMRFALFPLLYAFLIAYITTALFVTYFDVNQLDREDLNKKSIWSKELKR